MSPSYQCVFTTDCPIQADHLCLTPSCRHQGSLALYIVPDVPPASTSVLILAIPDHYTIRDLASFAGPDINIINWREISNITTGQVSCIVELINSDAVPLLCNRINGKPFIQETELEICYTLPLAKVVGLSCCNFSSPCPIVELHPSQQVPTCPRCLERIDISITGIPLPICPHRSSISSSHTSCSCVSHWTTIRCRLCSIVDDLPNDSLECQSCSSTNNLWMCLICCHVGCNRFHKSHAVEHFHSHGHRYSLELTNAISLWDYKGDGYIHRIWQDLASGTHQPSSSRMQAIFKRPSAESNDEILDSQFEGLIMYYNQLLIAQLQAQSDHFNAVMLEDQKAHGSAIKQAEEKIVSARRELEQLRNEELLLQKSVSSQQRKISRSSNRINKIDSEIRFIRDLNLSLCKDQAIAKKQLASLETTILEQQLSQIQELKLALVEIMKEFE